jgi:hypothetical protein
MKKFFLSLTRLGMATLTPWVAFLLLDSPVRALFALALQASLIGWLPASIWSYVTHKKQLQLNKKKT